MSYIVLLIFALIETLLFAQAPVFGEIPLFTVSYLLFIVNETRASQYLLMAIMVGYLYDVLLSGNSYIWFTLTYLLIAIMALAWRNVLRGFYKYKNLSLYLPLVVGSSIFLSLNQFLLSQNSVGLQYFLTSLVIKFIMILSLILIYSWIK